MRQRSAPVPARTCAQGPAAPFSKTGTEAAMRVLVTRPAHSATRTAQRLREMGHEPVLLPLRQPLHDSAGAATALAATNGPIAMTSAEAVRVVSALGETLRPHLGRPL